jgi:hypothetical protein
MLKVGWRTINLSRYLSATQAARIVGIGRLSALGCHETRT